MPRPLCIYHKNCLDGKAAAAVVQRLRPDVELLPMQYRETAPSVEGRDVYVVDFSLPLEGMRALRAQATSLTWIDHHASSVPLLPRLGFGTIDTTTCGAVLTWRTLFPGKPMPAILPYVEDKDLWRWLLPDSRAVAAGLAKAFGGLKFDKILDADPAAMAELGRPELAKQFERVRAVITSGRPLTDAYGLIGVRGFAVLVNHDQNEIAELACQSEAEGGLGFDIAVLYFQRKDGSWVHSLRSTSVDCAAIASRYGGGGHPNSAGYVAPDPVLPAPATTETNPPRP